MAMTRRYGHVHVSGRGLSKTASERRTLHRRYERSSFTEGDLIDIYDADGNVIDQRIYGISVWPLADVGSRPIDREINNYIAFLRDGKVPRTHFAAPELSPAQRRDALKAQYGDDWKNHVENPVGTVTDTLDFKDDFNSKRSANASLKKLLIACLKNGIMDESYIEGLLLDLASNEDAAAALSTVMRLCPGLINITDDGQVMLDNVRIFGDIDTKELEHGVGSHHHQMLGDDLRADPNKAGALNRIYGDAPKDPDTGKYDTTGGVGKRKDWEQSAYRVIAEAEANRYIKVLQEKYDGVFIVGGREKVTVPDAEDMLLAVQSDFLGKGTNATGRRWADAWMGDPSREDFGFDTAHAIVGGLKVSIGEFKPAVPNKKGQTSYNVGAIKKNYIPMTDADGNPIIDPDTGEQLTEIDTRSYPKWKIHFSIQIAAPYVGSLDDPDKQYDTTPFCVAVNLGGTENLDGKIESAVRRQFASLYPQYVKRFANRYGCRVVDNMYNPTAMCSASGTEKQEAGLKYLVRCACAAMGECIDIIEGVDMNDPAQAKRSVRMSVNNSFAESRRTKRPYRRSLEEQKQNRRYASSRARHTFESSFSDYTDTLIGKELCFDFKGAKGQITKSSGTRGDKGYTLFLKGTCSILGKEFPLIGQAQLLPNEAKMLKFGVGQYGKDIRDVAYEAEGSFCAKVSDILEFVQGGCTISLDPDSILYQIIDLTARDPDIAYFGMELSPASFSLDFKGTDIYSVLDEIVSKSEQKRRR